MPLSLDTIALGGIMAGRPMALALRRGDFLLVMACPFCGGRHWHPAAEKPVVSPCTRAATPSEYVLVEVV
jgi:hypothetical protein